MLSSPDSSVSAKHPVQGSSFDDSDYRTAKHPVQGSSFDDSDYRTLAEFRYALRKFLVFSEAAAMGAGLMPQQHQALLAIKHMSADRLPTVGDIAERLVLRHHSAVELVSRLARMELVSRLRDPDDGRRVRVELTPLAEEKLAALSATHVAELRSIRPLLVQLLDEFG